MCLPCARTRGEGAPLPGLRAPLGSCATFARKRSQGQRVKDAPLPIPARLPFACRPVPKLGDEGGKAPLPGWRAAAGRVATPARCGGRKRGGGHCFWVCPCPVRVAVVRKGGWARPSPFPSGPPIRHLHANGGKGRRTPPVSAHGPPLPPRAARHPGPALRNPHHSLGLPFLRKGGAHTLPVHTHAEPGFCDPSSRAPPCGGQGTHGKKRGEGVHR